MPIPRLRGALVLLLLGIHLVHAAESLVDYNATLPSLSGRVVDFSGTCRVTVTDSVAPLSGAVLNLKSDDIWLYFPNIRPTRFDSLHRGQILIDGSPAVLSQNIRLDQYLQGTMVISHPSTYKPLALYTGAGRTGEVLEPELYTYYKTAQLGALDNRFQSFRLKRGYMATLAENEDGTGASRVYVADRDDLVVDPLPEGLAGRVSFVRVFPWRWTAKKGWTNGIPAARALRTSWWYDWNNGEASTLDIEYVPMRHDKKGSDYGRMNSKLRVTHALGYNEPDRPDQADATVDEAIAAWPEMLKSGLRVGSPSPSDAAAGADWLFAFMAKADSLHYRVDFIPVHWYKGGQTASQFYGWLKWIHEKTKRPIWITEWNNGANWTCCKPTYEENAQAIGSMIRMMDTARFVERYSIYEWVEDTRQMFVVNPTSLTPAGVVYRDDISPMAYDDDMANQIHGACLSSPISPNILYQGAWHQSPFVTASPGDTVTLSPWPWSGGSWNWTGPGGFRSSDRTVVLPNLLTDEAGEYLAEHTNDLGCKSRLVFKVGVRGTVGVARPGVGGAWIREGVVHVVDGAASPVDVSISDVAGALLATARVEPGGHLDLRRMAPRGCLIVRARQDGRPILSSKVVLFEP
ncbi:MAG: hypothetical protein H6686_03720 [Fibrobacteria bacterium]|nr:hypothetical protein [Fibrobacteria bacterium]